VKGDEGKVCQHKDMKVKRSRQEDKEIGAHRQSKEPEHIERS